jgi:hypothetical protein
MFLGMGFDSRLAKNLTTRGNVGQVQNTLDRCPIFADNPQVQMIGRRGDDMSPCSADVRKAVPLPCDRVVLVCRCCWRADECLGYQLTGMINHSGKGWNGQLRNRQSGWDFQYTYSGIHRQVQDQVLSMHHRKEKIQTHG